MSERYAGGGSRDDDLPDMFVAEESTLLRTFRIVAKRSKADGKWRMESLVSLALIGPLAQYAPRPVDEDHVRYIYENYEVVEEAW